ncbi:MAG: hypothetical protein JWN52_41 [Actinomycetia bacterium]|nr:hypothetical protein [Actinomycetes bacterium]
MAQIEITAGPYRVVSLMSREAADEFGLDAGWWRSPSSSPPMSSWKSPTAVPL